jgi:hypothetical protein
MTYSNHIGEDQLTYRSNDEFFEAIKALVEDWCDKRSLRPFVSRFGPLLEL